MIRRRLADVAAELRSIADDVLGADRAAELWEALDLAAVPAAADRWGERLPTLIGLVQARFGRGFARELQAQLRLALEEYRAGGE